MLTGVLHDVVFVDDEETEGVLELVTTEVLELVVGVTVVEVVEVVADLLVLVAT